MIAEEINGLDLICEELPEVEADSGEVVSAQKDDIKNRFVVLDHIWFNIQQYLI